jgi:Na+/proline symporter
MIWFRPPWAAATLYPDAAAGYSSLGNKAADAVYLEFTRLAMPAGTVGLLMAALFAASMSSMDSALNKNSGIFIRSIYQPYQAKRNRQIGDRKLLRISQFISFLSGLLVIAAGLYFASLKELSLFELMMSVSTMVQVPLLVPLLFGIFVKKTPPWASWATVAVGLFVSWFVMNVFTADVFVSMFGIEMLTSRETIDMNIILTIGGHLFITAGFFCATTFFYDEEKDKNKVEMDHFFEDLVTPYIADDEQDEVDSQQRHKLGLMVIAMGAGVMLMALIPNPIWGRVMFVACAAVILVIGVLLQKSSKQKLGRQPLATDNAI